MNIRQYSIKSTATRTVCVTIKIGCELAELVDLLHGWDYCTVDDVCPGFVELPLGGHGMMKYGVTIV